MEAADMVQGRVVMRVRTRIWIKRFQQAYFSPLHFYPHLTLGEKLMSRMLTLSDIRCNYVR